LKVRLTDALLRSAKPPAAGRFEFNDVACSGLEFRITAGDARSWSFRFRDVAGKQTRATIGEYPAIGLKAARAAADAMRARVAAGGNPVEEKRAARRGASGQTFEALAARYLTEHAERHKRSHKRDARNLDLHVLPHWRGRRFATIRRGDVIELVERLIAAGKPTLANRMQSLVSSIFTFGMDSAVVEANPCHRLRKRGVENVGRRVLSDDEIQLFWSGIVDRPRTRQSGLGLRLALLTGARVGEVAGICRGELERLGEPDRAAWIIPGARTKNGREHLIPLVPLARDVLLELLGVIEPGDQYLLPTRSRRRKGHLSGNSLTQAMDYFGRRLTGDAVAVRTWLAEPPTPHDLRRTVATRLAELRIPKEIRDRVLNHAPADVGSKHYNLHDYADEKRNALHRWAAEVEAVVTGSTRATVVQLAHARAGGY
jgi:integrase